ncbi:MAG: 1-phosphatidylinositol 3-phosphate 5-kinase, partial [archaeon]|nr:1-phosphatidylinositol 3-phosphate 5-kinase [archaeon]
ENDNLGNSQIRNRKRTRSIYENKIARPARKKSTLLESFLFFSKGFDVDIIEENNTTFNLVQISMLNSDYEQLPGNAPRYSIMPYKKAMSIITNDTDPRYSTIVSDNTQIELNSTQNEREILKSVYNICDTQTNVEMKFYSTDMMVEKPLGKLIMDLCEIKNIKCKSCNNPLFDHSYFLYSDKGRIKISMPSKNEYLIDKMIEYIEKNDKNWNKSSTNSGSEEYDNEIYTFSYCNICKTIVSPLIPIPKEIHNFSASRFYKLILNNSYSIIYKRNENYNTYEYMEVDECKHSLFKDIFIIFITKNGNLSFSFDKISKYLFINTSLGPTITEDKDLQIKYLIESSKLISNNIVINFKCMFQSELEILEEINCPILDSYVEQTINYLQKSNNICENFIQIQNKLHKSNYSSHLQAMVNIKAFYCRIFQLKILHNLISNIIWKLIIVNTTEKIRNTLIEQNQIENNKTELKEEINEKEDKNNLIELKNTSTEDKKDEQQLARSPVDDELINEFDSIRKCLSATPNTPKRKVSADDKEDKQRQSIKSPNKRKNSNDNTQNQNMNLRIQKELKIILEEKSKSFGEIIHKLDKNENYLKLLSLIEFYDYDHPNYDIKVQEEAMGTLIASLITSTVYIKFVNQNMELKFEKIKREVINQSKIPKDDFQGTSLVFDKERIKLSYEKMDDAKIKQILETSLLNNEKNKIKFTLRSGYSNLIEELFNNFNKQGNLMINYGDLNSELKMTRNNLIQIDKEIEEIISNNNLDLKDNIKFKFKESENNSKEITVTAYYPQKFEILRILGCSSYLEFVSSISDISKWEQVSGGKSKANFFKTCDNRYVLKCISKLEFKMFLESGSSYFHSINKYFFHQMCSALAKVIGAFKVKNGKKKTYCVIMENLFYDIENKDSVLTTYDLKGSKINRYVKNRTPRTVLLDTNFLENFNGEPLPLDSEFYKLLSGAIFNDSLTLHRMNVVDYSLLLIIAEVINEEGKENKKNSTAYIKVGVIDYFRKYTWDKQLETVGKKLMHKFNDPTIIEPEKYRNRFIETIQNYFIGI